MRFGRPGSQGSTNGREYFSTSRLDRLKMTLAVGTISGLDQGPKSIRREREVEIMDNDTITVNGAPKKRKRVRKVNTDRKFECTHEGCGKSYSRAEHLYRHQLNRK